MREFPKHEGAPASTGFKQPQSGSIKLIARRAIPQPSAPEGLSNFRTLRTFGAKGSVNPHAKGVSKGDTNTL